MIPFPGRQNEQSQPTTIKSLESVMKSRIYVPIVIAIVTVWYAVVFTSPAAAEVVRDGDRTYLVDRTGERWNITQAVSIGFDPHKFEFGIGRHAFRPLTDGDWYPAPYKDAFNFRVIGLADGEDAHAYAVSTLSRHETANTTLSGEPVAAGY
jgi:hypothetical protein